MNKIDQFQRDCMRTANGMDYNSYFKNADETLLMNAVMGLNGEAGECIDIVKKWLFQGHYLDRKHLIEELGDVAWYLAVACESIDVPLSDCFDGVIEKLKKRYPDGFDSRRSINREEVKD